MQLKNFFAPRRRGFARHAAGAVALLFATMIIPILGLVGLAVDYGIWSEADASLSIAASSAALNAAKTAAAALAQSDSNYATEGVTAGQQWFLAEIGQGSHAAETGTALPTVKVVANGSMVTATVTYSSNVSSVFGRLFTIARYGITVSAAASMSSGSYLEVVLMLDNSSSMGIGATQIPDMQTLMQNSPCDPSNAYILDPNSGKYSQAVWGEAYDNYQYKSGGATYDGPIAYPVVSGSLTFWASNSPPPSVFYCDPAAVSAGSCPKGVEQCPKINGQPAYAGPPCSFACHSDGSQPAGLGNDLWALARHLGVTTRLDTLKVATNQVLTAMKNNNVPSLNNLSVGIYTFNTTLNPIYPGTGCTPQAFGCEAGSDWTSAINAVGLPPQQAGVYTDTGIQPAVAQIGGDNDNTEVEEAMSNLANNYVTAAGSGWSATSPRKVLMLVTDGMEDDPTGGGENGTRQAMPASVCQPFKTMGYTVFVIYTPYYPLMHPSYLPGMVSMVEGTGSDSITYNLQACASTDPSGNPYYIAASDQTSLSAALLTFLADAMNTPATFTQ